ncbi:MAG: hypothetical protein ACRBFS_07010 [Aureispira sp.]
MHYLCLLCFMLFAWTSLAAQNIGIETTVPLSSAKIALAAKKQGVLVPRVTLVAVADGTTPISTPRVGFLVYNLNKNLIGGAGVGFYYWEGGEWVKLLTEAGWRMNANGTSVEAMAGESKATGAYALAAGRKSFAYSYGETVVGTYNTIYVPVSPTTWNALDRIFVIGNGNSDTTRSNALTIYKSGIININDAYALPNTDGLADQVLTTNGHGVVTWQTGISNNKNQLKAFTPKNTKDKRGEMGDRAWDNNYLYIKTTAGWKRTVLTTF